MTVTMELAGGGKTYLHGIVGRFAQAGTDARVTTYYADLHPRLWLLTLSSDCRIFQNKTAPDIIKQVLSDGGITDIQDSLTGTYQTREYCVQYMETDFDFISRLMEDEGMFYLFTARERYRNRCSGFGRFEQRHSSRVGITSPMP